MKIGSDTFKNLPPPTRAELAPLSIEQARINWAAAPGCTWHDAWMQWTWELARNPEKHSTESLEYLAERLADSIYELESTLPEDSRWTDGRHWTEARERLARYDGEFTAIKKELKRRRRAGVTYAPGPSPKLSEYGLDWITSDPFEDS